MLARVAHSTAGLALPALPLSAAGEPEGAAVLTALLKPRSERRAGDAYFTPLALAEAIVEDFSPPRDVEPSAILEPSAGDGAFVYAMRRRWPTAQVTAMDVSPRNAGILWGDFLLVEDPGHFDLVIGNPPFLLAERFVRKALSIVPEGGGVAFLLRLSFLSSLKRVPLFREHPLRSLTPIAGRPSFTGDGKTDASEYAVFLWQRGFRGNGELHPPLEWKDSA